MYLDKLSTEYLSCAEKVISLCFPFLSKKLLEIKKRLHNFIKRTLPHCKLKVIFKSPSKIFNHFWFNYGFPLAWFIDFSVVAATLFIMAKQKVRATEHFGVSHFTNKLFKRVKELAISGHLLTCDSIINFNHFTILS